MNSTLTKVLIVDDTETNLDILIEALGDDYDISVAMDGERALEIAEEEQPDLYLIPSTAWLSPNTLFRDRDYLDKNTGSVPGPGYIATLLLPEQSGFQTIDRPGYRGPDN